MAYSGYQLNSNYAEPWIKGIGSFMINFGGIEWTTFLWLDVLAEDSLLKEIAVETPLSRRIEVIRRLLEKRELPKNLMNDSKAAWGSAEKLAKLRNEIAHNPIMFGWHSSEEKGPPDFIGSLNFRKINSDRPKVIPHLDLTTLKKGVDDSARITQKLHDLLQSIKTAIAA